MQMRLHQFGAVCHSCVKKISSSFLMLWAMARARSRLSGTHAYNRGAHANLAAAFLRLFNQRQLL